MILAGEEYPPQHPEHKDIGLWISREFVSLKTLQHSIDDLSTTGSGLIPTGLI
jgi:hypothetical protein